MREPYVPLFCSITDSTLWTKESSDTRVVFITLLAMMDPEGFVASSLPGIARRACVTDEAARAALAVLEGPDEDSRSQQFDGRRVERVKRGWRVLNAEAFRDLARNEAAKARKRAWWRANRGKDAPLDPKLDELDESLDAPKAKPKPTPKPKEEEISPLPPEGSLQERADLALRDPTRSSFEKPWEWSEVQSVFAAFQKTWRRALTPVRAGLGDPRVRTVLERFREGYSVDELVTAVRGSVKSENLQENPEHQTIQTVLRDGGQIDKWTALLAAAPPVKRSSGREQPKAPNEDFDRRRAKREAAEFEEQMEQVRRIERERMAT